MYGSLTSIKIIQLLEPAKSLNFWAIKAKGFESGISLNWFRVKSRDSIRMRTKAFFLGKIYLFQQIIIVQLKNMLYIYIVSLTFLTRQNEHLKAIILCEQLF